MNVLIAYHPKVRPPRAGGRKMGALATRTPHRPNPIGLTVARLERIEHNILHLSGIDLIDGTPICTYNVTWFALT
jgi:tRNA (Thr-GGU) A37 N-methylase